MTQVLGWSTPWQDSCIFSLRLPRKSRQKCLIPPILIDAFLDSGAYWSSKTRYGFRILVRETYYLYDTIHLLLSFPPCMPRAGIRNSPAALFPLIHTRRYVTQFDTSLQYLYELSSHVRDRRERHWDDHKCDIFYFHSEFSYYTSCFKRWK